MSIRMAEKCDFSNLISYIANDFPRCLYLFMNLRKYGCNSSEIKVFINEKNNEVLGIILKYHTCIHIFSKNNDYDRNEIIDFLLKETFLIVQADKSILDILADYSFPFSCRFDFAKVLYCSERNLESDFSNYIFEEAIGRKKIEEAARLYFETDLGKSYIYDDLVKQMLLRSETGYGRTFLLKNDLGELLGSISTWAENEDIAIESGLVVAPKFRGQGLAKLMIMKLQNIIKNKDIFAICYNEKTVRLHESAGMQCICDFGSMRVLD